MSKMQERMLMAAFMGALYAIVYMIVWWILMGCALMAGLLSWPEVLEMVPYTIGALVSFLVLYFARVCLFKNAPSKSKNKGE